MTIEDNNVTPVTPDTTVTDTLQVERDALYNKNQELLSDLSGLKAFKRQIEELGGLDTINTLVEAQKASAQQKLEDTNSVDQLKEHFNTEIATEKNKNNTLIQSIVDAHIETQLRAAVTKSKGSYELLDAKLRTQVTGEFADGKVKLTVIDANGLPMLVDGNDGSLSDLVESYKTNETYARAFDAASDVTGSGAPVGGKVAVAAQAQTLEELTALYKKNPAAAMEAMKAKGFV